jgi:hypothetical protein
MNHIAYFPRKPLFDSISGRFAPHPAHKSTLRAEAATHSLAPGKPGWPPTSLGRGAWGVTSLSSHSVSPDRWPLSSRPAPLPAGRELGLFFRSIPPWFVL